MSLRKLGYSLASETLVKVDSVGLKTKNLSLVGGKI
jgi:hypothetical protein